MITTLRSRKENAYNVAPPPPVALEDRLVHLQASPQAVAWDLYGNRLLYHRADWHYRVIAGSAGSSPEEIVDYGRVDCVICALPAAAGPLTDVAQGQIVALVASDEVPGNPGYSGPRIVEVIATDPVQGQFAVYSHREDVESPYVTELSGFDASGGLISAASLPQPPDDTPRWHVPHAVLYDDILYAVERDATAWPEAGPATGRIVRRAIGNLGGLVPTLDLPEGERFVFPHTLAYNPDQAVLHVFATLLVHQDWTTHQTSTLSTLRATTLELLDEQPVDFGFQDYDLATKRPYYLGTWEAAGGRQHRRPLRLRRHRRRPRAPLRELRHRSRLLQPRSARPEALRHLPLARDLAGNLRGIPRRPSAHPALPHRHRLPRRLARLPPRGDLNPPRPSKSPPPT